MDDRWRCLMTSAFLGDNSDGFDFADVNTDVWDRLTNQALAVLSEISRRILRHGGKLLVECIVVLNHKHPTGTRTGRQFKQGERAYSATDEQGGSDRREAKTGPELRPSGKAF